MADRYGYRHRQVRARIRREVEAGRGVCWRCGGAIHPAEPWDLGHDVTGREHLGAEHRACNRSEGARRGNALRVGRREEPQPFPQDGNMVVRWSQHWFGGFNERCPECRRLGVGCPDAAEGAESGARAGSSDA